METLISKRFPLIITPSKNSGRLRHLPLFHSVVSIGW